ncbi:restriction endonuclease subunit S [Pseudomonas synxantha]|uniref:Type I restriction enzyme S subunit n=1 Tax=Pseudomonas synxantha TaxID=47883 RepID=A0ACC6JR68_9PSED|nr:restriction endonuclease subunit S [Pseudomonas synxantha]MDR6609033.1 type I restriction enzyme S subunit [Pseudomonas synxantha]
MSKLPFGWATCTVGELIDRIETGKSVKCDERPPTGSEKGLVKISAVTWGEFDEEESKTLLDHAHLKPNEKIQQGDFLISRANTLELVGSCVLVKSISKNLYLSDKVLRLVLADQTKPWLLACLKTRDGRRQIESLATGNQLSMRNISQQAIREIKIPLPPLAEQTRIAQKLDKLLAQVDTLKARFVTIPTLLKRFRQSVLSAAISGRLVGDAECWHPTSIGDICVVSTGKTPKRDILSYWEHGDIPWLTSAVTSEEFCSEAEQFVTEFALKDCSLKIFQPGTLLMAMYGEGKTRGQVTELKIAATCNQACAAITVNETIARKEFVKIRLQENYEEIRKQAVGGAQPNLNLNKVRELSISLPSLEEQTEIVRRVEQLFAFADQLEAKVTSANSRIDYLTQSILAKAFRGELVPQDPNDDPASELLARIKAQHTAAPKDKRARKNA